METHGIVPMTFYLTPFPKSKEKNIYFNCILCMTWKIGAFIDAEPG